MAGLPHITASATLCGQTNSVAKGFRHNKSGKVRLRRCKSCGRRWTVKDSVAPHDDAAPVPPKGQKENLATSDGLGDKTPENDRGEASKGLSRTPVEESSRYVAEGKKPEPDGSGQEEVAEKHE